MPRIRQERELSDGWSRWVAPVMANYKLACCDCGLVHNMQFQVVKVIEANPDGSWSHGEPRGPEYRVLFRAARNNRSTAAMRRKKKDPNNG